MLNSYPEGIVYQINLNQFKIDEVADKIDALPKVVGVVGSNNIQFFKDVNWVSNGSGSAQNPYKIISGVTGKIRIKVTAKMQDGFSANAFGMLLRNGADYRPTNSVNIISSTQMVYTFSDCLVTMGDVIELYFLEGALNDHIILFKVEIGFDFADWPGEVLG